MAYLLRRIPQCGEFFCKPLQKEPELPMPDRVAILKLPGERVVAAAHHNVVPGFFSPRCMAFGHSSRAAGAAKAF
eukprot:g20123.t1